MKNCIMGLLLWWVHATGHAQAITYYLDIAPIVNRNCVRCHTANGAAPFALNDYKEVKAHGKQIAYVVENKIMPPCKTDPSFRRFVNQHCLPDSVIKLIHNWIAGGMEEGKKTEVAEANRAEDLGKPGLVLSMDFSYKVKGNNTDQVARFLVPYHLPSDTFAYAIEVVPGNARAVHHANPMLYDADMPAPRVRDMLYTDIVTKKGIEKDTFSSANMVFYADFVPGAGPQVFPADFGVRIPRNGYMVLEIHYAPLTKDAYDQTKVNFYLSPVKPSRTVVPKRFGSGGGIAEPSPPLVIPADSIRTFTIDAPIPFDLSVLLLGAHMHYLGKSMKAICVTPSGDTIPLIKVDDYDFRWQESYRPEQIIHLPRNSHVIVTATFDNTGANPFNPYHPPRLIRQGWRAVDEMMSFPVYITEYQEGDENIRLF